MEINAASRHLAFGARAQYSQKLCIFCTEEKRISQSALAGVFMDLKEGNSFLIRSGISRFYGAKRGEKVPDEDCSMCWGDGYESKEYKGIGIPVEMGIIFGGKNFGFGITAVFEFSEDNSTGGLFLGIPMGSLGG